jgi:hypothetical protein
VRRRRGRLGDADGSGVHVLDEVVPEIACTRLEREIMRIAFLDTRGSVPHDVEPGPPCPATRLKPAGCGVPGHKVTADEFEAAVYPPLPVCPPTLYPHGTVASEWEAQHQCLIPRIDPRAEAAAFPTLTQLVDGERVLDDPDEPTSFRSPNLWGVSGGDTVSYRDLPPGSKVLVRWPSPVIPRDFPAVQGAPIYRLPVWHNGGEVALAEFVAVPAARVGVSTGDRHDLRLLHDVAGNPLGYMGWYETGGSGNFWQSGVGKFIARELAEGIVEVVVDIIGNVLTPGAGFEEGQAAGGLVSALVGGAAEVSPSVFEPAIAKVGDVAASVAGVLPAPAVASSVGNVTGVAVSAAVETAAVLDRAGLDRVFAIAALLTTYFLGLDNLLFGLGDLFRRMAIAIQQDPGKLAAALAKREGELAKTLGQGIAIARSLAQSVAQVVLTIASAGAAAPYIAAVRALETALNATMGQGDLRAAGLQVLEAAAAFLPLAGPEVAEIARTVENAAKAGQAGAQGDWTKMANALVSMAGGIIPDVGAELATLGHAIVLVADTQDRLRQMDLKDERARASAAAALQKGAQALAAHQAENQPARASRAVTVAKGQVAIAQRAPATTTTPASSPAPSNGSRSRRVLATAGTAIAVLGGALALGRRRSREAST